jgi:hypothetical protein
MKETNLKTAVIIIAVKGVLTTKIKDINETDNR